MGKNVEKAFPSQTTLTKCIEDKSKEILVKIKEKLVAKPLFVALDET